MTAMPKNTITLIRTLSPGGQEWHVGAIEKEGRGVTGRKKDVNEDLTTRVKTCTSVLPFVKRRKEKGPLHNRHPKKGE